MQTVIYADVLVALNIYLTYLLLVSSRLLLKLPTRKWSMLAGSLCGGFFSLTIFAEPGIAVNVLLKLTEAAVIVLLAFLPRTVRAFLKAFAVFFSTSFVFGGAMLALELAFSPAGMVYKNGTVYFDVSILFLVLSALGCYALLRIADWLLLRREAANTLLSVTIHFHGRQVTLPALYDTGNLLRDFATGRPVLVAETKAVAPLLAYEELLFFTAPPSELPVPESLKKCFRLVPCRGIGGDALLPAFLPEKVIFCDGTECRVTEESIVALSGTALSDGEYRALLPAPIWERSRKTDETVTI